MQSEICIPRHADPVEFESLHLEFRRGVFEVVARHGLRLNPNLTMAVKSLMQAEAIATALSPDSGLQGEGVKIIQEEVVKVVTADRVIEEGKKQLLSGARELVSNLPDLSLATVKWLNQYKKGRFEVTVDTSELAKEVDKIGGMGRQVVIAILLVGMLIGTSIAAGAIAISTDQTQLTAALFRVILFGFLFALVVSAFSVLRLIYRWMRMDKSAED